MSSKDKRFISPSLSLTGSGIHSISYSVVTAVTTMELKGLRYEADRSQPSGTVAENRCSFTGTLSYAFVMAKCQLYLHLMSYNPAFLTVLMDILSLPANGITVP